MTSCKITVTSIVVLLAFIAMTEGMSLAGAELRCHCIITESRPIGRLIEKVELRPASSHCEVAEIIATLKQTGQEICLDTSAPWVKKVIDRITSKITSNKKR